MSGPYGRAAKALRAKGWRAIPVDTHEPGMVPRGVTGYNGEDPNPEVLAGFQNRWSDANIGIVMPKNVVAIDVDLDEEGGKDGADTYWDIVGDDFPATYSNGHTDDVYRHWFFRVPDDVTPEDVASLAPGKAGIDVLRWMHRWSRVAPSVHRKSGDVYYWTDPSGERCKAPRPEDLPQLTREQWDHLVDVVGSSKKARYAAVDVDVEQWLAEHAGKSDEDVREAVAAHWGRADGAVGVERHGSHHSGLTACLLALAHLGEEDHPVGGAIDWLREKFLDYREDEGEFDRCLVSAIEQAVAKTEAGERTGPVVLEGLKFLHPEQPGDQERAERRAKRKNAYNSTMNAEPVEFAREYLQRHYDLDGVCTLRYVNKSFWRWSKRKHHWVEVDEDHVRQWIMDDLRGAWEPEDAGSIKPIRLKMKNVNEVLAALKGLVVDEPVTPTGGVPFRDGWLDVVTGELTPLTPNRFHTWCVPASYSDNGDCPGWLAFLESIGWGPDTDEYRLLRQWFGYLLSGENDRQKMLLLHGPTRSGKGTILAIAWRLLGDGAVGLSLGSLAGEFGLQPLLGKSLGVVGDARFTARIDKNLVERLLSVSGKDPQSVNIKNKAQVSTRLPTRLMMATNPRPVFTDSSDAIARRFLILHMNTSFLGREDLGLEDRLTGELPGIVRWSLDGYRDLVESGHFARTEVGDQMVEDFVRDSAPIRYFVEENCEIAVDDGLDLRAYKVRNDDLYMAYTLWGDKARVVVLNRVHFMRELLTAYEGKIVDGRTGAHRLKYGIRLRQGQ